MILYLGGLQKGGGALMILYLAGEFCYHTTYTFLDYVEHENSYSKTDNLVHTHQGVSLLGSLQATHYAPRTT